MPTPTPTITFLGRAFHYQDGVKLCGMVTTLVFFASIVGNIPSASIHQSITNTNHESFLTGLRQMEQIKEFHLPYWGSHVWCDADNPFIPPNYEEICDPDKPVNLIALQGSTPAALRTIVLAGMLSITQGRCFVVDDPVNLTQEYFEPIGLPRHHHVVTKAEENENIHTVTSADYWSEQNRYTYFSTASLLNYTNYNGHLLKKIMLQHLLKLRSTVREDVCDNLEIFQLGDEFMTLSVGQYRSDYDKLVRGEAPPDLFHHPYDLPIYIRHAKYAFETFYNNRILPIYVATDKCEVVDELRALEPDWKFFSECDHYPDKFFPPGELWNNAELSDSDRKIFLRKFFIDLWAMATSSYFIGLGAADSSWIAYFMRGSRGHFIMVDKLNTMGTFGNPFDLW